MDTKTKIIIGDGSMFIDRPLCNLKCCRFFSDYNCMAEETRHEKCPYKIMRDDVDALGYINITGHLERKSDHIERCEYCNFDSAEDSIIKISESRFQKKLESGRDIDVFSETLLLDTKDDKGYILESVANLYSEDMMISKFPDHALEIHYCPVCGRKLDNK